MGRIIRTFLAIIGFILALALVYFSFFPLKVQAQQPLYLGQILSCTESKFNIEPSQLNSENISILQQTVGNSIPLETIASLANSIKQVSTYAGSKQSVEISFCGVPSESGPTLEIIEKFLNTESKYYDSGSIDYFVRKINNLPFAKLTTFNVKVPSLLARTSYCNKPINESDIYLFSYVRQSETNFAVMFKISLQKDENATDYQKIAGNLLQTGQFLKSKYHCR